MSAKTPLLDQLAVHDEALAEATTRVRALKRDTAAGKATIEQLRREAGVEPLIRQIEEAVKRLRARRTKHDTNAIELLRGTPRKAPASQPNVRPTTAPGSSESTSQDQPRRRPTVEANLQEHCAARPAQSPRPGRRGAQRRAPVVDLLGPIDGVDGHSVPDNEPHPPSDPPARGRPWPRRGTAGPREGPGHRPTARRRRAAHDLTRALLRLRQRQHDAASTLPHLRRTDNGSRCPGAGARADPTWRKLRAQSSPATAHRCRRAEPSQRTSTTSHRLLPAEPTSRAICSPCARGASTGQGASRSSAPGPGTRGACPPPRQSCPNLAAISGRRSWRSLVSRFRARGGASPAVVGADRRRRRSTGSAAWAVEGVAVAMGGVSSSDVARAQWICQVDDEPVGALRSATWTSGIARRGRCRGRAGRRGSMGQPGAAPLAGYMAPLERPSPGPEQEFGMTPVARMKLGIATGEAAMTARR